MKGDLFGALRAMQSGSTGFFDALSDAEAKALPPYMLLLWMRSPMHQKDVRIEMTNEFVNPFIFSLGKHPRLLYKLFCSAQGGYGQTRFNFDKKIPIDKRVEVVAEYKNVSISKAKDMMPRLPVEVIEDMARELGWEEKQIKELKNDGTKSRKQRG